MCAFWFLKRKIIVQHLCKILFQFVYFSYLQNMKIKGKKKKFVCLGLFKIAKVSKMLWFWFKKQIFLLNVHFSIIFWSMNKKLSINFEYPENIQECFWIVLECPGASFKTCVSYEKEKKRCKFEWCLMESAARLYFAFQWTFFEMWFSLHDSASNLLFSKL